jgi:rubrerythrin
MKHEADRALQVAVEMERLGKTFYESLAAGCGNREIAALAATLAKSEESHAALFKRMREKLPPLHQGPKLTDEELFTESKVLRDKIMPNADTVRAAVTAADPRKALDMAIAMEAHAVSYYTKLAVSVGGLDAEVLRNFVKEEYEHLNTLRAKRERLFPKATNP